MRSPYVSKKISRRTGQARYTGMYFDLTDRPRSAGTYATADQALAAARREQENQGSLDSLTMAERRQVTFEEFWPIFRANHPVEPNSMQRYASMWRCHLRPYIRHYRVATFDGANARLLFTALRDAGTTASVRKESRTTLSAMMGLAIEMGYRHDNPIRGIKVGKVTGRTIKVINEVQFWTMCGGLPLETQRLFAEYIISTGVRFCEAISFEEGDLDYETGMLEVNKSTVEVSPGYHPTGGRFVTRHYTKNGEQRRFRIGMPLTEKIKAHVDKHGITKGELVFPIGLFKPPDAPVNHGRLSAEEMAEAAQRTITHPESGRVYGHCTFGAYRECKCRCPACVQWIRGYRAQMRWKKAAERGHIVKPHTVRDAKDYLPLSVWHRIWQPARDEIGLDVTPTNFVIRMHRFCWSTEYLCRTSKAGWATTTSPPPPDMCGP